MARPYGYGTPYRQFDNELPYDDDPDIGETERAKRRKSSPRGTGTGTPAIEEGGTYRPGSTFSQSMRGGQQQPGTGNVLGMPPQPNFIDRAKTAVINTAQGMNNMVDAGQNALATVQRPDVAPARPPEGAASRNARAYADRARADLATQAGMPTTTRAPVPVTQAAPAGYQPGQAFAQNMQQTPAVMPSPAVAMQPEQPAAPYTPPFYIRAAQASNDAVDAVQNAFTPAPQQQLAQAPAPQATADDAVMYQQPRPPAEPARSRSGPITESPVTYAGAPSVLQSYEVPVGAAAGAIGGPYPGPAAGAIGGPYAPPQQVAAAPISPEQIAQSITLPTQGDAPAGEPVLVGTAPKEVSMSRGSIAPARVMNQAEMERTAPVTDESFRGSSVPIPSRPGDEIARDLNTPYPGGPTAAATRPGNQIARIQETALSTLSSGMDEAKAQPWRQDAVRSRAETRGENANRMQFFSDEAQRNQRAANGPSWNELEQAKSAARYADMTGIGKKHAAARLDAIQKAYSEANAPAAHRDYVGQQIAQTASVDQTAGLQQAQRHSEQTHPLAIAKGVQDIAAGQQGIQTAQTAQQAAQVKLQQDRMMFDLRKEYSAAGTTKERKQQIVEILHTMSDKPLYQYHAVGGGEIDGQKQPTYIGGGNVVTGQTIGGGPPQAIGQPAGGRAPVEGETRYDATSRKTATYRNGAWVVTEEKKK